MSQARWLAARFHPAKSEIVAFGIVVFFVSGIVWTGPIPKIYGGANSFTTHPDFYTLPIPEPLMERVPAIYSFLHEQSDSEGVVEVPWPLQAAAPPYGLYQSIHGKEVWSVSHSPVFREPGVQFARMYAPRSLGEGKPVESGYVILHRFLTREILHVSPGLHPGRRNRGESSEVFYSGVEASHKKIFYAALDQCRRNKDLYEVYSDKWTIVFAVGRGAQQRAAEWVKSRRTTGRGRLRPGL